MIINEKSQTDLSSFYVVYKGSVLNEDTTNYGISHASEHLKCKEFKHLYDDFDRYSINWNAYTSSDKIVFYMNGLDEYVNKYKYEFLDSLSKFTVSKDEFLTEKEVIIQEYKDVFQDQSATFYYNILRREYKNYGAIGKLESLKKIKYKDVVNYCNKFLSKPSMIINVSKHNDFIQEVDFQIETPSYYISDDNDELKFETKMKFNKSCIIGYIKADNTVPYSKVSFVLNMLSMSLLSPFWNEIREKRGLTYNIDTSVERISENQGFITTQLIITNDLVDDVLNTYEMILTNPDEYLTEERFSIIKDYFLIKRKKNDIERYKNINKYIVPKHWQLDLILDDITFDECKDIFNKYLSYDKWTWEIDKK